MSQVTIRFIEFPPKLYKDIEILYSNSKEKAKKFGSPPVDLIKMWRGDQLLSRIDKSKGFNLELAYQAVSCNFKDNDEFGLFAEPFITEIGEDAFWQVMKTPIPKTIVRFIINSQNTSYELPIWTLEDELESGTVDWCKGFENVGLYGPPRVDIYSKINEHIISSYEYHLKSFSEFYCYPKEGLEMTEIGRQLIDLETRGVAKQIRMTKSIPREINKDQLIIALAGAKAMVSVYQKNAISIIGIKSEEAIRFRSKMKMDESVEEFAKWMFKDTQVSIPKRVWLRLHGQTPTTLGEIISLIEQQIRIYLLPD